MAFLPLLTFGMIRWMRRNNRVRPTVATDGGRGFETKVLTFALVAMTAAIEGALLWLSLLPEGTTATTVAVALLQIAVFVSKLMVFNLFFILVRWTLPRFRYDQVQHLGWYYMLPLALFNLFVTALVVAGGA